MSKEIRYRVASFLFGTSLGSLVGFIICDRTLKQIKKLDEKRISDYHLIMDIFKKMEKVMVDVTLSGSEKDEKVKELETFLEIVLERDLKSVE